MMRLLKLAATLLFATLLTACNDPGAKAGDAQVASPAETQTEPFKILVFFKTAGFVHYSIPLGLVMLQTLGSENNFVVDMTSDAASFTSENLAQYKAIIWLNTTGTVLDTEAQRTAMEDFIRQGGGYVGIHSAADTEYDWPFYEQLVGTYFKSHGLEQPGTLFNEAPDQPSTAHLPEHWSLFEEFYSFRKSPRDHVNVLLSIDESSYHPDPNTSNLPNSPTFPAGESGVMGDHPMSWCHTNLGGTAWYTALGHEGYLYFQPEFKQHVLNGILTAARQIKADCNAR